MQLYKHKHMNNSILHFTKFINYIYMYKTISQECNRTNISQKNLAYNNKSYHFIKRFIFTTFIFCTDIL